MPLPACLLDKAVPTLDLEPLSMLFPCLERLLLSLAGQFLKLMKIELNIISISMAENNRPVKKSDIKGGMRTL